MISEIDFSELKKSKEFAYAEKLDFFKTHKKVEFKPGLNVLFGPNGCGKSTILRMAAMTLAAEQGGVSTITTTWLNDIFDFGGECKLEGIKVSHDGQPLMYGNPRNAVGLFGGGAAFDDDFFSEGIANIQSKASTGLTTMNRLNRMLAVALGKAPFPAKFDERVKGSTRHKAAMALLKASIPVGQQTLIFDEPESGLGLPVQGNLFSILHEAAKKNNFQLIIATHSAFALGLPNCNFIEMSPDYLNNSRVALEVLHLKMELQGRLAAIDAKVDAKSKEDSATKPAKKPKATAEASAPAKKPRAPRKKATE
jgi:predicted ATPase